MTDQIPQAEKVAAIEGLWRLRADLSRHTLEPLIGDGRGPLAIDALGLVPLSRDAAPLTEHARAISDATGDERFKAEVGLLQRIVADQEAP